MKIDKVDRESAYSPVSFASEASSSRDATATDGSDTVPSRMTERSQGPTNLVDRGVLLPRVGTPQGA